MSRYRVKTKKKSGMQTIRSNYGLFQKIFIALSFLVLLAFAIVAVLPFEGPNLRYQNDSEFLTPWVYTDDSGSDPAEITLPHALALSASRTGASIVNTLPANIRNGDRLYINLKNSTAKVTIGGRARPLVNPEEQTGRLYSVPQNSWAIVELTALDANNIVRIEYNLPHIVNSTYIGTVLVGSPAMCLAAIYADNITVYMAAMILLFLGFFIFLSGVVFSKEPERRKLSSLLSIYAIFYSIGKFQYCSQTLLVVRNSDMLMWIFYVIMVLQCLGLLLFARQTFRMLAQQPIIENTSSVATVVLLASILIFTIISLVSPIELSIIMAFIHIALIAVAVWILLYTRPRIMLFKYPSQALLICALCLIIQVVDLISYLAPGTFTVLATATAIANIVEIMCAWIMVLRDIYVGIEENRAIREQLMDSKVQLMISQIRPHFIYNVLNSINILIPMDAEKAQNMVQQFSLYLRKNMNAMEDFSLVPFKDELEHIKAYVDIEKVRFPRISVAYEIDESNFSVPVLSVEPLVENAIKHGVARKRDGGMVTIRAYRSKDYYCIEVKDNGVGFDISTLESEHSTSIGIKNITYRIETMTKGNLSIASEVGVGTTAVIKLPAGMVSGSINRSGENENNIG